ncbi:hypothetical protein TNCV_3862121 [Trichonephila clavipes]|nr:hypothetical protein TNCV_3862121 [Trichonephila clavipes]
MYMQDRFRSYRSIDLTKTEWNCTRGAPRTICLGVPPTFQHFLEKFAYVTDRHVVDFSNSFQKHPYARHVVKNDLQHGLQGEWLVQISGKGD